MNLVGDEGILFNDLYEKIGSEKLHLRCKGPVQFKKYIKGKSNLFKIKNNNVYKAPQINNTAHDNLDQRVSEMIKDLKFSTITHSLQTINENNKTVLKPFISINAIYEKLRHLHNNSEINYLPKISNGFKTYLEQNSAKYLVIGQSWFNIVSILKKLPTEPELDEILQQTIGTKGMLIKELYTKLESKLCVPCKGSNILREILRKKTELFQVEHLRNRSTNRKQSIQT